MSEDGHNLPRMFAADPKCMEALAIVRDDDEQLAMGLLLAAGGCQAMGLPAAAASCLVVFLRLFPDRMF